MTKISVQKNYDTSKVLQTEAGKQLADFIQYMSQFTEQTVRALNGGIGVSDNLNSQVFRAVLQNEVATTLNIEGSPIGLVPLRIFEVNGRLDSFSWFFSQDSEIQVIAALTGLPTGTPYTVDFLIVFS